MNKKSRKKPKISTRQLVARIWRVIHPMRWLVWGQLALNIIAQIAWPLNAIFLKYIVNSLLNGEAFRVTLTWVAYWTIFSVLASLIGHLSWYMGNITSFKILEHIENHTIRKTLKFSVGQYVSENTGIKFSRISRDISSLEGLINSAIYNALPKTLEVIFYTVAFFVFGWQFGLLALLSVIINIHFIFFFNKKWTIPRLKESEKKWRTLGSYEWELYHNVDIVKQNAQEQKASGNVLRKLTNVADYSIRTWSKFILQSLSRRNLPDIALSTGAILIGTWLISQGELTVGSLVVIIYWLGDHFQALRELSRAEQEIIRNREPVRELFEMLEIIPDIQNIDDAIKPRLQGNIEFRHICFGYEKSKAALNNVSFHIRSGERVAFVGESGSGKTTITRLLQRFYDPRQGQILIDGHDLRELDLQNYLQQIGTVSQDVKLFDATLRSNILYGLPQGQTASHKELEKVAKLARIDKFYHRLTKKFNTMIGENGIKLSGGEKQRVSIARAMIKNPKILIFDEATSSLDVESESEIQKAIQSASQGRTTIVIAHRLCTIINSDRIFVMRRGKLIGEGSHSRLVKSCPYYAELMRIQIHDLIRHNFPNLDKKGLDKILRDLGIK